MKVNKFLDLCSKQLGNDFKIMKKYLEIYFKNLEKSWNFVSSEKWEPGYWYLVATTKTRTVGKHSAYFLPKSASKWAPYPTPWIP